MAISFSFGFLALPKQESEKEGQDPSGLHVNLWIAFPVWVNPCKNGQMNLRARERSVRMEKNKPEREQGIKGVDRLSSLV